MAAHNSALASVSDLAREEVGLDERDANGRTGLHQASAEGNVELVKILLENGANMNARCVEGRTPFHVAVISGKVEVMTVFLDRGVSLEDRDYRGCTALHLACKYGPSTIVNILLQRGANAGARNINNQTPIHVAVENLQHKLLRFFLKGEVNLDSKDNQGRTLLHYAVRSESTVLVHFLLAKGAYVDTRDSDRNTPLHIAAQSHSFGIVELLFAFGASVRTRNKLGLTAMNVHVQWCTQRRCSVNFDYLRQCVKVSLINTEVADMNQDLLRVVKIENPTPLKQEVDRLRVKHIADNFYLISVLERSKDLSYMLNMVVVEELETLLRSASFHRQFPNYGYMIITKYKGAKRSWSYLTEEAYRSVSSRKRERWCHLNIYCWRHIYTYLHKEDLVNFAKSMN